MSVTVLTTHREFLDQHYDRFFAQVKAGEVEPYVLPLGLAGILLLVLYLLLPHYQSRHLRRTRFLAFALLAYIHLWTILNCKGLAAGTGFGIGLIAATSLLSAATILVVYDAQIDFERIERTEGARGTGIENGAANGDVGLNVERKSKASAATSGSASLRKRSSMARKDIVVSEKLGPTERTGPYAWQPYPASPFVERLDWVGDLVTNLRGMGWNWSASSLPPPPPWVEADLEETSGTTISSRRGGGGPHVFYTRKELLRRKVRTFIFGYIALDVLKVLMMKDPYFWGAMDLNLPPPDYLPEFITSSSSGLKLYRLLLSLAGIYTALVSIFSMAPLFFVGLLGPKRIGVRGEPWMYPDPYGSYSNVLDKGLAGWWGGWWHQTFRVVFESPSRQLIKALNLDRKSLPAKLLQLFCAFFLSGVVHASGSHTQVGTTHPIRGPFLFFMFQPLGIITQLLLSSLLNRAGVTPRMPKLVRQITNFAYVHVWFYMTGPLLCDDFARGGVWLFEPVAISPLRGLGLGAEGDGWWCWGRPWFDWHQGKHFWQTGWAI